MVRRAEMAAPAAATAVVLTVLLGGGFWPLQRMWVGVALVLVGALAAAEWSRPLDRVEVAVGLLLLWGVVVALWVGAAPLASKEALTVWLVAFVLWSASRRASAAARTAALRVLAAGAAVVAAAIVVAAVATGRIRVGGLLENPNLATALLVPSLPLAALVFDRAPRWLRWSWLALVVAGVIAGGSRAGLIAALVVVAVMLPRGRARTAATVAGCALAVAVLVWRFVSQPDLLAWHRVSIWRAVIDIWATRPLTGVGPGSLLEAAGGERILHPDQVGRYQFVVNYAESTPLAILVQLGAVGAVLALLGLLLWAAEARRSGGIDGTTLRATVAAMAVMALFHDLLTADPVLWWWAVLVGCLERPQVVTVPVPSPKPGRGARWAVGLALTWLLAWGILAPAMARWLWRGSPGTAPEVARALRVEPWDGQPPADRVRELLGKGGRWGWETAAEALHWAEVARRARPGLATRWAEVGRVHLRVLTDLGGTDFDAAAAEAALDRACELDPHLPWHWLERARLARAVGDRELAISLVRRALEEEPNTVRGWLLLGRLEFEWGRAAAARSALGEALERAGLADRPGLTDYELELLRLPAAQSEALARDLGEIEGGGP